jgi:hypothetical protein
VPNTQIFRGAPATVNVTLADQYGEPRSGGDVVVTVTRADGTAIRTEVAAVDGATTGVKQITLDPADTNALDELRFAWQEEDGQAIETTVEVVGGYYFTVGEARKAGPGLDDADKYPDALVRAARATVEEWIEKVTGRAFVPRFTSARLSGNDRQTLWLPHPDVRRVRSLGVRNPTGVFYADGLDTLGIDGAGRITAPLGSFPYGAHNIEVAYEYGLDSPPQRIKTAALMLIREALKFTKTGAPDSATYQVIEGRVFGIPQPGVRGSRTGIPHVDEALDEWEFKRGSAASVPYG